MDLFYDSLDPTSIASVAKWLAAFAARLALTFVTAMAHTDIRQRLLLTASQIWVLCLVLAGYAAVHFLPGLGQVAGVVDARGNCTKSQRGSSGHTPLILRRLACKTGGIRPV